MASVKVRVLLTYTEVMPISIEGLKKKDLRNDAILDEAATMFQDRLYDIKTAAKILDKANLHVEFA